MTRKEQKEDRKWGQFILAVLLQFLTLGLTMVIFPTTLNPGIPILLGGALSLIVGAGFVLTGPGRYFRPASLLSLALSVWMLLSSFFTLDSYLSWRYAASFWGGTAMLLACAWSIQSRRQWRISTYGLLAFCTLSSLFAWFPALGSIKENGSLPALMGNFNNPDTFAVLPVVGLFLTIGLIEKASNGATGYYLVSAAFLILTLFATGCRAAMVGLVVGGLFFAISLHKFHPKTLAKTKMTVAVPLAVVILVTPILGYNFETSHKWQRVAETEVTDSENIRLELLQNGWKAVLKNPILGCGPGAFGFAYQTVRPPNHEFHFINIAHNDFLEVATECGLPGLAMWLGLTVAGFTTPFQLAKTGRRPTEAAAIAACVLALATFSLFNFIIVQRPALWVQMWVFGLALSFPSSRVTTDFSRAGTVIGGLILAGLGGWSVYTGAQTAKADSLYAEAILAEQKLELEKAENAYSRAEAMGPMNDDFTLRHLQLLEKQRLFFDIDNLEDQEKLVRANLASSPKNVKLLRALAEVLERGGQNEKAGEVLETARKLVPYEREVFHDQVEFLIKQGNLKEAAEKMSLWTYGHPEETHQFAGVLYSLFLLRPAEGQQILEDWLTQYPDERGSQVATLTADLAEKNQSFEAEASILEVLTNQKPEDFCLKIKYAKALLKTESKERALKYLDTAVKSEPAELGGCYSDFLSYWSQLNMEVGNTKAVEERLRRYLELRGSAGWARAALAEILRKTGRKKEAVSVIREGLANSADDEELNLAMARHYEQEGSIDLALSYYREVAKINPDNTMAKAKLAELVKKF